MIDLSTLTLDRVMKHCTEEGDCLIWNGSAAYGIHPQIRMGGKAGKCQPLRRVIFEVVHEKTLKHGQQVGTRCGTLLCVHPDCLIARTRSQAMKSVVLKANHALNVSRGKQAKSKLTIETIRAIRASDEIGKVLEARYGLSAGYASKIKRGLAWRDLASPFNGLGAR